jgi:hypothetical protein
MTKLRIKRRFLWVRETWRVARNATNLAVVTTLVT